MHLSVPLAATLSLVPFAYAYPRPGACSGVCGNAHDPAVMRRADGTYFRYSTGGKVAIHSAPSIAGPWTYKGAAIPQGSKINIKGRDDLWAPEVAQVGNTYYLYYSVSSFGVQNSAIGYATSTDLQTWADQGATGIKSEAGKNYNAIDANLVATPGGFVMNFGSFWGDIMQVPMSNPPTRASSATRNVVFQPAGEHAVEGAFQFATGGYHYMFFSEGKCCALDKNRPRPGEEYKIMVCRSTSATGPFVDNANRQCTNGGGKVVLPSHDNVYAPGGQSVFMDTTGPVLVYHYVDKTKGYSDGAKLFGWNKLDFSSGWPVAV